MNDDEVLNAVFRFKHKAPSDRQDEAVCHALAQRFAAFAANLEAAEVKEFKCGRVEPLADDRVVPASTFAVHEVETLQQVSRRITTLGGRQVRGGVWYDPWLPKYGCVIQRTKLNATVVKFELIFVDAWERTLHFLPTGECVHSAVPVTHHVQHCADLDMESEAKFSTTFASELRKAQSSKGSDRSAATNDMGHQKTPQFIDAVVKRAIGILKPGGQKVGVVSAAPRGGTTDVGLHTGGRARDTCWPIVQAAIAQNLCCGAGLFRKSMVGYQLKLLQSAVNTAESTFCGDKIDLGGGCTLVDDLFYMLQVIVQNTVELLEGGYDVSVLMTQYAKLRSTIDGFVDILNQATAGQYVLPENTILQQLTKLSGGRKVGSPKRITDSGNTESSEDHHQRAWANLGGCCFLSGLSCSLSELLRWSQSSKAPEAYQSILVLRTMEVFMFEKALLLSGDSRGYQTNGDMLDLEHMQTLVQQYQQVVKQWCQRPRMTAVLDVEQRSREMLIMWIAFCLVHQKCVAEVPLCAQYNIALNWEDLKVAVLRDQAAIVALQHVAKYIRSWNVATGGQPLFHLTNQEPTFEFGQTFGLSDSNMLTVYNREVTIWEAHVQRNWSVIQKKKQEAIRLRNEITQLHEDLQSKQILRENENERLRSQYPVSMYDRRVKAQLTREIKKIRSVVKQKESTLSGTLAVPPYLVRPLPPAKCDAIQVIFMLSMPRNIEILGGLCLIAQRALAPVQVMSGMTNLPNLSTRTWQQFYYERAPIRAFQATSVVFTASPAPFSLPRTLGPTTVNGLYSVSQYSSECVWDPTLHGTALTWTDASGRKVNPFGAAQTCVIDSFIEKLPQSIQKFQWMNAWPGEGDEKGNVVYANLHQQPDDYEKVAFIALGLLRAFPNQQYRKLQCALWDDILPWSDACVQIVVRQSLYQVGVLTDETDPRQLWKTDMHDGQDLHTFCATLWCIANKLEQTPRRFESVPLLSELAGFVSQYSYDSRTIVKAFAEMARHWAENARSEYKEEASPVRIGEIRRRECVLYGFALLAYSLGPWDDLAAQEVSELIVLFRTSFLCASINLRSTSQMLHTESKIAEVMSRRIAEIIAYVKTSGTDIMLTGLVHLINPTSPEKLKWKRFHEISQNGGQFGSCFEAYDKSVNVHYSINVFTGLVLTDGYPPGGLPNKIRQHKQFRSLFGYCNFEVFSSKGVFRTERKYCDRLYDFSLENDGDLLVRELSTNASGAITMTIQLCSTSWTKRLKMFPAQLRELYSHWYWVEGNCVLFRSKEAKCREVFYIANCDASGSMQCYKVPFSDTERSYKQILKHVDEYDQFVRTEDMLLNVFKVLSKFEGEKFLHPLKSPLGVIKIELPRYNLTFSLNNSAQFESEEHKGYILSTNQQFDDFLPRFSQYLVLELNDKSDTSRAVFRMLLPVGIVEESSEGMVVIRTPSEASSVIDVVCYDIHRRLKTFETETISARLQLAVVCARAGTNVPSKRLRMTGAEAAIELLRACRSSRPFSNFEVETLLSLYKLSFREPAVKIMAGTLLREADRLAFLFGQLATIDTSMSSADEKAEYSDTCVSRTQRNPLRSQLQNDEEKRILGHVKHLSETQPTTVIVSCEMPPVGDDYVKSIETELKLFLRIEPGALDIPPLPLDSSTSNAMGKDMMRELQVSWDSYHAQTHVELKTKPAILLGSFMTLLGDVSSHRAEMEAYLWGAFSTARCSTRDRLLALVNFAPRLTVSDVVRCAFDDNTLHKLMPKLSQQARVHFKNGVLRYMEICVLEDKVERLILRVKRSGELSDAQLVEELINIRQWKSTEFPYWLAFEVEGRLQIRHEQYVVARHLIDQPGTVCQLNMGRGKTRVILPMLFLHFSRSGCPRVVRAHFLTPLLSEAQQFMHRYLSASSAHLSVFEQPFHRQIELSTCRLEFIRDNLEELKLFGGIQIVAPEHRMSLELKRLEVSKHDPIVEALDEILDSDKFVDVLDECDALLHHKYHLVYAVGTPIPLCSGMERWMIAQALLRVVADKTPGSRVNDVLQAPHVSCFSPDYLSRLGAYNGTRLKTIVESTVSLRDEFKKALILDLIENAPFELMWLKTFGETTARDSLVKAVSDSISSLEKALGEHMQKLAPYMTKLLALRGLVAFGVFEHCLEKRYRVNFGLPAPGTRAKKIAIPFRAADVPSERSEFSHPDVCIVLTLLGYYHGGLASDEIRSAFRVLLRLDISEQHQQYDRWYTSVKSGLDAEERKTLCDVRHISLADAQQFEMLCRVYKFCMEAINFYLNSCVFPKDTQQYPQRLSRTAWNLTSGDHNIGFSGTNDNHRLLPLSVTQQEPNEPLLLGTNGKMVDKILQVTHKYEVVRASSHHSTLLWQSVLLFAMNKNAQALIDTGALLAGVTNDEAAKFLLSQPGFSFAGVTYYDSRAEYNCWMIAEKARRIQVPLKKAAMLEKETFVIFDDARARGSDMKLLPDAVSVQTLGPKLTKDNFMQGAGRMRQLGCNQTLWITSFDEVAQSILQTSAKHELSQISTIDVLNWVMDNTKTEAVHGLLEWAGNGIHFRKTQLNADKELVDEDWSLETLYQEKIEVDKIAQVIKSKAHFGDFSDEIVAKICRRGFLYGLDNEVCVTSHTDECERELQIEEEVQQEREVQVMRCSPAMEKRWAYRKILRVHSIEDLIDIVNVLEVTKFIHESVSPKALENLDWDNACIFGTENFFSTVKARRGMDRMNEFLRVIDVVLVFNNGQILLVSECEADHILELLWANRGDPKACNFSFVNLAFACECIDRVGGHSKFRDAHLSLGCGLDRDLPLLSLIACHVYNGETMLTKHQQDVVEPSFRKLLEPLAQREATLGNFVKSRGNSHKWTRSFLHELCCQMDLGDCK
ncbi:unnamed protein product [Phytophthora fragariaefolia]|uniref:ubiquitinyl hydrolase 1 n=1 Tax=Phytophthora fragariaefolia TaxID=1490495 RepID=A0A9W7D433_9STRA|nr:unnamed protein product [Phytophthora fragariaefolia]